MNKRLLLSCFIPLFSLAILGNGFSAEVRIVETTSKGARLQELPPAAFVPDVPSSRPSIAIDPAVTKQTIIGIGGAFTEASATVLNQLPKAKRSELIEAYFGTNGSAYTLCRTHIGSSDFSNSSYSYDETPGDVELKNFNVDHDKAALIPLIKDAMAVSGTHFQILASPWTPPSWMTTKNRFVAKGNQLKPECYKTYAEYLVKYIQAYQKEGIPIPYLTMQNEVLSETATWESCQFQPAETVDFMKILGAAFEANRIGTKILIYDHNKGLDKEGNYQAKSYADKVYSDADAKKHIWGVGLHWYGPVRPNPFGDSAALHEAYPDKHLIHTEACAEGGPHPFEVGVAERYGHDIIGCLNNWTEGWIDWNLVLNTEGGPNHAGNLCSAPILADVKTGNLIYNPSYYYLAHFSKYFRPGSVIVNTVSSDPALEAVACRNEKGNYALTVMNAGNSAKDFKITIGGRMIESKMWPHSMRTFLF